MPSFVVLLSKAFIQAHSRRLKNGNTVQIAAYYDKRVKKAAQHAPEHASDVSHLSDADKTKFGNMHKEQHVAHYYEGHALSRKLESERQLLATLERSAKRYEDAGDKKSMTAVHNKIIKLKQSIMRHERMHGHIKGAVEGISKMKEKLVRGSGELNDDADKAHSHYVGKLGERFKSNKQDMSNKPMGGQGTQKGWLDWVNSQEFKDVSFPEFKRATTSSWDDTGQKITYFFNGKPIVSYYSRDEPNAAPLRKWYNGKVEESEAKNELQKNLPKGTVAGDASDIKKLAMKVAANEIPANEKQAVRYAIVNDKEAEKLKLATGLNLKGYKHTVDSFGIRHAISQHGDEKKEAKHGQIAVTAADISLIPEIVSSPDSIEKAGVDANGNELIRYAKKYNGTTHYVEEVRQGRMELVCKTLYKTRTNVAMPNNSRQLTPKTTGGNPIQDAESLTQPSKNTTPQEGERNADGLVFRNGRWHRDDDEPVTVRQATQGKVFKIPAKPDNNSENTEPPKAEDFKTAGEYHAARLKWNQSNNVEKNQDAIKLDELNKKITNAEKRLKANQNEKQGAKPSPISANAFRNIDNELRSLKEERDALINKKPQEKTQIKETKVSGDKSDSELNKDDSTKEGDTKEGADGTLTFKDGRWHRDDEPVTVRQLAQKHGLLFNVATNDYRIKNGGDTVSLIQVKNYKENKFIVSWSHVYDSPLGGSSIGDKKSFNSLDYADKFIVERLEYANKKNTQATETKASGEKPESKNAKPQEGGRNAEGLVFRGGRWHRDGDEKKEPWQMTGQQFDEQRKIGRRKGIEATGGKGWGPLDTENSVANRIKLAEDAGLNPKDVATNWPLHKLHVAKAVKQGKAVPSEVLASYPDLVKDEPVTVRQATQGKGFKIPDKPGNNSDDLDPNSPNYRYRDTGVIAGGRKEKAAAMIKHAGKTGARLRSTDIDWAEIETNPREAKELITKSNLFGAVDWEALKADGMEPGAGFLVDRVYASIAKEPEDSSAFRKDYAVGLETLRDRMEKCKTPDEVTQVLGEIRSEWEGVMMTAKDSDEYAAARAEAQRKYDIAKAAKDEKDAIWNAYYNKNMALNSLKYEQEKRIGRKWKPDPELAKRIDGLQVEVDAAYKADSEHRAAHPELIEKKRDHGDGWVSHGNDLQWEYLQAIDKADAVLSRVKAKNLLENPVTRAWAALGAKFHGVINYRRGSGSKPFQTHVTTAKTGKVKDWSWAKKDNRTVETGKGATKKEVRFQLQVAETMGREGGKAIKIGSTQALKDMFGLRDVQSGNWVLKDPASAAFHVQKSAEAFSDLGDILGVGTAKLAMNGRLALALGARGTGNAGFGGAARAHYEPVQRVINLTKMGGGGCLGHEWFHSLDNMAAEMEGGVAGAKDDYITENPELLKDGKLKDAVMALRSAVFTGDVPITTHIKYEAKDVKTGQYNFDRPTGKLAIKIKQAGNLDKAIQEIDMAYGGRGDKKSLKSAGDWKRITVAYYDNKPEGGVAKVKTGSTQSSFAHEAKALDGGAQGKYWSKTREMMARAFQSYIEDKLEGQGRKNDYLSSMADNKHYQGGLFGPESPFPEGEERKRINAAFDVFTEALRDSGTLHKAFGLARHKPKTLIFFRKAA